MHIQQDSIQSHFEIIKYLSILNEKNGDKTKVITSLKEIIEDKDSTYSPLALYFLIDNNITIPKEEMVYLFDRVIVYTALPKEIRNLILFKKAIYFSESESENSLLSIL